MSPRQDHPENVAPTQPDTDDRDVIEYLQAIIDSQIIPSTELEGGVPHGRGGVEGEVCVVERGTEPDGERRARVEIHNPDGGVYDLSPVLTPREMDTYLRGLSAGVGGKIDRLATHREERDQ